MIRAWSNLIPPAAPVREDERQGLTPSCSKCIDFRVILRLYEPEKRYASELWVSLKRALQRKYYVYDSLTRGIKKGDWLCFYGH